jgi:hypothetical protein
MTSRRDDVDRRVGRKFSCWSNGKPASQILPQQNQFGNDLRDTGLFATANSGLESSPQVNWKN